MLGAPARAGRGTTTPVTQEEDLPAVCTVADGEPERDAPITRGGWPEGLGWSDSERSPTSALGRTGSTPGPASIASCGIRNPFPWRSPSPPSITHSTGVAGTSL